ncbi:MAG: hypothetical protein U1A77_10125 [Pirellulales bacterium]
MCDPIAWLWSFTDARDPVFDAMSMRVILGDVFDQLVSLNFVVRTANAVCVSCPACGGHGEEVVPLDYPDGTTRYYVPCPQDFRVEVHPVLLERWTINWDALAQSTASALALAGQCTPLIADRLWRLGRIKWKGTYRDAMLARGLSLPDGRDVARQIARNTRPVVFVGDRPVPADVWVGREPPLVRISQVASFVANKTLIDADATLAAILLGDVELTADNPLAPDPQRLKLMIRRQIRAEGKTRLTDDILMAAYQQEGSVRKAATFLSKSTGQVVTKDRIQNAVMRSGGSAAAAAPSRPSQNRCSS